MSKMKSFQVIALTLSMLMMISMVKGRWLDLETYSTSMLYAPNLRLEISNSSTLYAEQRCKSLYGFFPCADTMLESVFLMFMYMYFMILGEELMRTGSKVLFQWIGDKAFGESVFGVLKALPKIAVFVVPGVLSSASDAQDKVVFGVSMYAGSTVITLTLVWGIRIILSRYKLKKRSSDESEHPQDSTKNRLSLKHKLPFETDKDVKIDKETGYMAVIMLLSIIPFAFVGLLHFINTPAMTLFALMVSGVSLIIYWVYQVKNSWIRYRSLAYLKEENLRTRFFYHVIRLADFEYLVDKQGNLDVITCFKRIFDEADKDNNKRISHNVDNNKDKHISHNVDNHGDDRDELGDLVQKMFMLKKEDVKSKESAKAAILIHFDRNNDKDISWEEFKKGCSNWIEEAISSGSLFENIWNQAKAINKQRSNIRIIEKMALKILEQALKKQGSEKGEIQQQQYPIPSERGMREVERRQIQPLPQDKPESDKGGIEGLFSQLAKNGDHVHRDDLKEFIKTLDFGIALDHDDKVLDELVKDFDLDGNQLVEKNEFVDGFIKWIEKATDPKKAIEKFEEDWGEMNAFLKPEKPKATIVYAIFGLAITITTTSPFIASVKQFSTVSHIPFLFTSFVMAPIAMKAKTVIVALLNAQHHVRKNPSLAFSEIYDQLVMDNLIGFVSLLAVVYIRGLSWTYSAEVLAIMIPCAIVGVFAIKRDTYPIWASISAILLYPVSVYIYYVLPNAS